MKKQQFIIPPEQLAERERAEAAECDGRIRMFCAIGYKGRLGVGPLVPLGPLGTKGEPFYVQACCTNSAARSLHGFMAEGVSGFVFVEVKDDKPTAPVVQL
jgi:hypothetical protein